jgi:hypothetical protein
MFGQPCRLREFQRQQKLPRHPDDRKAAARLLRAPIRARFWREWAERGRREEGPCACLSDHQTIRSSGLQISAFRSPDHPITAFAFPIRQIVRSPDHPITRFIAFLRASVVKHLSAMSCDLGDPLTLCHSERGRSSATRSDGQRGTPRMFVQPCRLREFLRQQKLPRHPDDRKAAARLLQRGRRKEGSCACLSDHQTIRSPGLQISAFRSPDHPITAFAFPIVRSSDHQIIRSPDHPITRFIAFLRVSVVNSWSRLVRSRRCRAISAIPGGSCLIFSVRRTGTRARVAPDAPGAR